MSSVIGSGYSAGASFVSVVSDFDASSERCLSGSSASSPSFLRSSPASSFVVSPSTLPLPSSTLFPPPPPPFCGDSISASKLSMVRNVFPPSPGTNAGEAATPSSLFDDFSGLVSRCSKASPGLTAAATAAVTAAVPAAVVVASFLAIMELTKLPRIDSEGGPSSKLSFFKFVVVAPPPSAASPSSPSSTNNLAAPASSSFFLAPSEAL